MSFECGNSDTEQNKRFEKPSLLMRRTPESNKAAGNGQEDLQILNLTPATRELRVNLGQIYLGCKSPFFLSIPLLPSFQLQLQAVTAPP